MLLWAIFFSYKTCNLDTNYTSTLDLCNGISDSLEFDLERSFILLFKRMST